MAIDHYLRQVGRGRDGARALERTQAGDLFGQVLDGIASDLEVGAFCMAMRFKGETPIEMAGFLDATRQRTHLVAGDEAPVVLPCYNGARKLPGLTPLLALLLARHGAPVLLHGAATESARVTAAMVMAELGMPARSSAGPVAPGEAAFLPTGVLCPGLERLLQVRRAIGVRNPAHSLVKLMNPCAGRALVVGCHTHLEYQASMSATFELMHADALLLRGTEGEPVADPRRTPGMTGYVGGVPRTLQDQQAGGLRPVPELPSTDAGDTARYIEAVLAGRLPLPEPIAVQVEHLLELRRLVLADSARHGTDRHGTDRPQPEPPR
ncbi:DNA-binding protein YbiB [Quisquiliibacterium transsilvanicum]|uniref:Anthranilate phosphoribosyltransferase n=1 Tax=Quisquiliibacterium transsilvanicum TaxID=1549638 RepID=A0A7W8HHS8_9BURK|nr:DNA-binding protein YbiB [Quisquiliibacterium transsilvanicum]MBB5272281.1 anthranilate phosphoribosyltransferase [Quisquiliibacterium transsilvanicum]